MSVLEEVLPKFPRVTSLQITGNPHCLDASFGLLCKKWLPQLEDLILDRETPKCPDIPLSESIGLCEENFPALGFLCLDEKAVISEATCPSLWFSK